MMETYEIDNIIEKIDNAIKIENAWKGGQ